MQACAFDVAIVGAGVTGSSLARKLTSYKLKVAVLEKEEDISSGVSKANSGIIHAGFHHKPGSLKARLELKGNAMYDQLQAELNFPFKRVGILVAAFTPEEMKTVEALYNRGMTNGVPGLEICNHARMAGLEPKLNPDVVGGLYAPTGGIVEPYRFVFALMESAVKNGAGLFTGFRVSSAVYNNDCYTLTSAAGESITARYVINAAGLYADDVSRILGGEDFRILPRKGEEYLLEREAAGFPNHVIFPVPSFNSKGVLVIPTVEGTMMIGPTATDTRDKEDTATTEHNLEQVFSLAMKMIPAISKKEIITSFAGLRPCLEGEDFLIARSDSAPHLIQAAGIQSPGLTAAPAIADYVVELLARAGLELEPNPGFDPCVEKKVAVRYMQFAELAALAAREPAYANIVCRCETVSEGEIIAAIEAGHKTLDGIKFYSRAGMGRCQGAFCTYKILKILVKHCKMPITEITKRGGNSRIILDTLDHAEVELP